MTIRTIVSVFTRTSRIQFALTTMAVLGCSTLAIGQEEPAPTETRKAAETEAAKDEKPATEPAKEPAKKPAKPKRAPIYVEEENGKELIAAALKKAKRDHKRVLVEWGGNWCGWCYKLHDVFHKDETVYPIVHEEFELVLIDSGPNEKLMKEFGGETRQYSYPHLTILDADGKVLTNQETGSLEEGDHHDPKLVTDFLKKWTPEKIDASKLVSDSIAKAAAENKRVFVRVGTPYCGWCNVLAQFMQDHEEILGTDYVDIKIDTMRMENGEEVAAKYNPDKDYGGIPWFVILDGKGKTIANSFGPEGNIGHPYQPKEIAHFMAVLRATRQKLSDEDLKKIEADLNAYRVEKEAKAKEAKAKETKPNETKTGK